MLRVVSPQPLTPPIVAGDADTHLAHTSCCVHVLPCGCAAGDMRSYVDAIVRIVPEWLTKHTNKDGSVFLLRDKRLRARDVRDRVRAYLNKADSSASR